MFKSKRRLSEIVSFVLQFCSVRCDEQTISAHHQTSSSLSVFLAKIAIMGKNEGLLRQNSDDNMSETFENIVYEL